MQLYIIELILLCVTFFIIYKIRKNPYFKIMLCRWLVKRGRCLRALSNLEKLMRTVVESLPENKSKKYIPLIQISLGKCYLQKYKTDQDDQTLQQVINLLDSSIADFPKDKYVDIYFDGLIDLGMAYYQRSLIINTSENLFKSIYFLKESHKLTKKSDRDNFAIINYQLGLCYLKLSEIIDQKENLMLSLERFSDTFNIQKLKNCKSSKYEKVLVYSCLGAAHALGKLGRYEEALDYYNQAIGINPGMADIYCDKAEMLYEIGNAETAGICNDRYKEALQCCNRAVELDSELLYARYIKGNVLKKMEKYQEAIEVYSKALEYCPEYKECRSEIAHTYFMLGDFENALHHCNLIIGQDPKYIGAYIGKGSILDYLGKNQEALKSYFKVLELNPDYIGVYGNIIRAFLKLGKADDAMKFINTALNVVPDYFELYYHKGYMYFYLDEIEMAMECFDKAIELNPDYVDSYIGKAGIFIIQGDYIRAIEVSDIAIKLDSENRYAYYIKGQALDFMEEYEKAKECYKKADEI